MIQNTKAIPGKFRNRYAVQRYAFVKWWDGKNRIPRIEHCIFRSLR